MIMSNGILDLSIEIWIHRELKLNDPRRSGCPSFRPNIMFTPKLSHLWMDFDLTWQQCIRIWADVSRSFLIAGLRSRSDMKCNSVPLTILVIRVFVSKESWLWETKQSKYFVQNLSPSVPDIDQIPRRSTMNTSTWIAFSSAGNKFLQLTSFLYKENTISVLSNNIASDNISIFTLRKVCLNEWKKPLTIFSIRKCSLRRKWNISKAK